MTTTSAAAAQPVSRNRLLFTSGLGWMFDAMDVGLLSFILAALKADWGLSAGQMGWLGAINSIGMAVGAIGFGMLADRIGRKQVFVLTLLLFAIASGLSAFATTLTVLFVLRFFIGMGLGGELPVASTYVSERVPAHERGRIVVLLESFWAVGWILAALIAYFVIPRFDKDMGWRVALLLGALPAFYALYLRRKLPDDAPTAPAAAGLPWTARLAALWSPAHARSTVMLWVLWFTVVFSYYGMFLWLPSVMVGKGFALIKSFEYVLLMTLAQLPGYFTAAWLIERAGRKFVLVVYLTGTAASAWAFGNADTQGALLLYGALLSFFNLGAWGALYAYSPENYPAPIRASGVGTAAGIGRLGGILGPLAIPFLGAQGWSTGAIFGLFAATLMVGVLAVALLGRETRGEQAVG
ncbi:MAG TPA: MFS transporter [Ottowia sp.]|nr:MFS transporter [Burkholderiales bacterium]MCA0310120.1 MFS transporter [Pseudomonadota bacterium]OJV57788.1 MAG: MFS transporter [Burkholderiales bacterium 68-10]HMT57557.1 MFS transporter [Ottowia sp.]HMT65674.1 MFS transporter [Ottowia sp.]